VKSMRKLLTVLAAALAISAVTAGAAQAVTCPYYGAEQKFKPWGDLNHYVLGPDGGFENGAQGWTLKNGAAVVSGNESFYLNDASDSQSLSLPAGSSAISPPICMSIDTPFFRMFGRNAGNTSSGLRVEAIYNVLGLLRTNVVSTAYAGAGWAPTKPMSTVLGLSTVLGTVIPSAIQLRITPVGSGGQWQIDDLYIDPFARR